MATLKTHENSMSVRRCRRRQTANGRKRGKKDGNIYSLYVTKMPHCRESEWMKSFHVQSVREKVREQQKGIKILEEEKKKLSKWNEMTVMLLQGRETKMKWHGIQRSYTENKSFLWGAI